jgi:NAD-dependent dihydropyrimidine dehydrogenase PreA subunit
MAGDVYKELCARLMVPDSERLAKVWRILCDESEARLILEMPGTAEELAGKTNLPLYDVERRLNILFRKGVVFIAQKPQGAVYRPPRHLIQMHDASVQWPEAPQEFYDAWKDFMGNEYAPLLEMMLSSGFPSFMRVVPASGTLGGVEGVLDHENVKSMILATSEIAVVKCPCRLSEKNCKADVELCIQFNNGATYNIRRGTGRKIDKDEALRLMGKAEDAGLVHTVENRSGIGNVLCNCCNDCCAIIRPYLRGPATRGILAPSRFMPVLNADECIGDSCCEEICPVGAAKCDEKTGFPDIDEELCIGCGLCVSHCTTEALSMKTVRPPDFIPA